MDFGADEGVVGTPPPLLGAVCLVGWGGLGGRGGLRDRGGAFFGGGGTAPSVESSCSKCHLELFLSPILVTGGLAGGGLALVGWGGGGSSFTASSLSQSPPTLHAHISLSSAPVCPACRNLAHSTALCLRAPTHTSEHTLRCSQSLNPLKMANPKGGLAGRGGGGARVAPHGLHRGHARTRARDARLWR